MNRLQPTALIVMGVLVAVLGGYLLFIGDPVPKRVVPAELHQGVANLAMERDTASNYSRHRSLGTPAAMPTEETTAQVQAVPDEFSSPIPETSNALDSSPSVSHNDYPGNPEAAEPQAPVQAQSAPVLIQQQAALPVALTPVDLLSAGLSSDQWKTVDEVAKQFAKELGSTFQNPYDPAYLRRWESEREISDQLLKARVGSEAFVRLQLAAMRAGENQ